MNEKEVNKADAIGKEVNTIQKHKGRLGPVYPSDRRLIFEVLLTSFEASCEEVRSPL